MNPDNNATIVAALDRVIKAAVADNTSARHTDSETRKNRAAIAVCRRLSRSLQTFQPKKKGGK